MSKLKPKNLKKQEQSSAFMLPDIMSNMENATLKNIPLSKLKRADSTWNFFKTLNDEKMEELISSILENGLIHSIVVSDDEDGTYTILSGHNRVLAYTYILERTRDSKYSNILSSVRSGISEDEKREIIIDSNWVQRSLSPSEKSRSIYDKYIILGRKKRGKNGAPSEKHYETIANDYDLSGRQVLRYIKLNNLIDDFLALLDEKKITMRASLAIASFDSEIQSRIFDFLVKQDFLIESKNIVLLKKEMAWNEIESTLLNNENEFLNISFKIPKTLEDEFFKMAELWLEEKTRTNKKNSI